jgi:hypothetical protein
VEEPSHAVAQVDEDAELGVAVHGATVESAGFQLAGTVASELEDDVLLVGLTDVPLRGGAADNTFTHYFTLRTSP